MGEDLEELHEENKGEGVRDLITKILLAGMMVGGWLKIDLGGRGNVQVCLCWRRIREASLDAFSE